MRELTVHKVNGVNDGLKIAVMDEPGHGGACHKYNVTVDHGDGTCHGYEIDFQNGPIKEVGANGLTHETLLAILIDRLNCFQVGAYRCDENAHALGCLIEAMDWLQSRTRARLARGVEGTHQK